MQVPPNGNGLAQLTAKSETLQILLLWGFAFVATSAWAQSDGEKKSSVPFAHYVPSTSSLFVNIRRVAEADRALSRARVWPLASFALRTPSESTTNLTDLRGLATEYVQSATGIPFSELVQSEIGFVLGPQRDPGDAVWLVRLQQTSDARHWFPPDRRVSEGHSSGAHFFTDTGLAVSASGDVAAISRRLGANSLIKATVDLMQGRQDNPLDSASYYQELIAYLPPDPLATLYWTGDEGLGPGGTSPPSFWRSIQRALVGLYEGDGRIDVAIRAAVSVPRLGRPLSPSAVERMLQLPQTTLLALATTIDGRTALESATRTAETNVWGRYLALAATIRNGDSGGHGPLDHAGPNVVLAWGRDLSAGGHTPQVALLVESTDPELLRLEFENLMTRLSLLVYGLDVVTSPSPAPMRTTSHLGRTLTSMSLTSKSDRSPLPIMRQLTGLEPTWTVLGRWLVIALTREHVEQIVDAEFQLTPTLRSVPDLHRSGPLPSECAMVAVAQPALAAGVMSQWLSDHEAGNPSLLDSAWWNEPAIQRRPAGRLGVGLRTDQQPGMAVVARVAAGNRAAGGLQVGDRIIGVDGNLLALESPNSDLRRRLLESTATAGPRLRVLRADQTVEIVLPRSAEPKAPPQRRLQPAEVVRELAALARSLDYASFAVLATDDTHYSARLSLRFGPIPVP